MPKIRLIWHLKLRKRYFSKRGLSLSRVNFNLRNRKVAIKTFLSYLEECLLKI